MKTTHLLPISILTFAKSLISKAPHWCGWGDSNSLRTFLGVFVKPSKTPLDPANYGLQRKRQKSQKVSSGLKWASQLPIYCPFPARAFLALSLSLFLAGCVSNAPAPQIIAKSVTIQYNPTGSELESIEVAKAFFMAKGFIEGQLPVEVKVLDPSLTVDRSSTCEVKFVPATELMYLSIGSAYANTGLADFYGADIYPCKILLSTTLKDPAKISLILRHEIGHILLNQYDHSKDPRSIMSNNVQLPGQYRFTDADIRSLSTN